MSRRAASTSVHSGEIYAIIDQLASTGVAVWMISSDMEEVLGMSDRILVLHEGTLAGELQRSEFSEEAIMCRGDGRRSSIEAIMKRILGVVSLLALMYVLLFLSNFDRASKWDNLKNVLNQQAFFAILTIGAGLVIITGGIDLSIGSVIGLSAVGFLVLMRDGIPPIAAFFLVLLGGALIGLNHGLWITRLKLQPFLVTLCGLFIYRGLARIFSGDQPIGLQEFGEGHAFFGQLEFLRKTLVGKDMKSVFGFPMQTIVMLVIALLIGIVLHASVYGRYWYAIGHNEQAARTPASTRIDTKSPFTFFAPYCRASAAC